MRRLCCNDRHRDSANANSTKTSSSGRCRGRIAIQHPEPVPARVTTTIIGAVGTKGSGKSSLLRQLTPVNGVPPFPKGDLGQDVRTRLRLWEGTRPEASAHVLLVAVDLTDPLSLALPMTDDAFAQAAVAYSTVVAVVGTKADLVSERRVTDQQIAACLKRFPGGALYFETSAKADYCYRVNVDDANEDRSGSGSGSGFRGEGKRPSRETRAFLLCLLRASAYQSQAEGATTGGGQRRAMGGVALPEPVAEEVLRYVPPADCGPLAGLALALARETATRSAHVAVSRRAGVRGEAAQTRCTVS